MKRIALVAAAAMLLLLAVAVPAGAADPVTVNYGGLTLNSPWTATHWADVWDLTQGDLYLSYTIDMTGLHQPGTWDTYDGSTSYTEVGLRGEGAGDFNPGPWNTYQGNCGGWMVSDDDTWNDGDGYTERGNPDPDSIQDLDDKHGLQASGGRGELDYDVLLSDPDTVLNPAIGSYSNYGIWYDRDGVDPWQDDDPTTPAPGGSTVPWGAVDGGTYNTGGIYDIVIRYHAIDANGNGDKTDDGLGVMFATINGIQQGFYYPNWHTGAPDYYPAGLSFKGDMEHMQVFAGLWAPDASYGPIVLSNISVNGYLGTSDPLVADFTYSHTPGETSVQFTDTSHGGMPPYTYLWDFGDTTTSTEANPNHTYDNPGTYTVSLTVTPFRCVPKTVTKTIYMSHIIVDKVTDPAGSSQLFTFDPSWSETDFTLADGSEPYDSGPLAPGPYSVAETVPAGWVLTSADCVVGRRAAAAEQIVIVHMPPDQIDLQAGETATCTFTNQGVGRIIVEKVTDPADAAGEFEFDPSWGEPFTLSGGESHDSGLLSSGIYSVAEIDLPDGWSAGPATCGDGSPVSAIGVSPGETVTCTFHNTREPSTSLTISKVADPADGTSFEFSGGTGAFALASGESQTFGDLQPGEYTVTEALPAGWSLDDIVCTTSLAVAAVDYQVTGESVAVNLRQGEAVTCTFYNSSEEEEEEEARLTIAKVARTLDPDLEDAEFSFTGDLGDFALASGESETFVLEPGVYGVAELLTDPWLLDPAPDGIVCTGGGTVVYDQATATVTVALADGDNVTCTFHNYDEDTIGPDLPYTGNAWWLPTLLAGLMTLLAGLGAWVLGLLKRAEI